MRCSWISIRGPAGCPRSTDGVRRPAWLPWLWLLPAGAILLPFFLLPLAAVLRDSVYRDTPDGVTVPAFTGANYAHVLTDPYYLTVFGNTLIVAAIVTALSLLIAYPFAQLIVRVSPRARILLLWCVYLPLYVSVIMRAFGWMVVTADSGLINQVLLATGLADRPVRILYEASGMTLGMLHRYLPLMIIPLVSALQKIDGALRARLAQPWRQPLVHLAARHPAHVAARRVRPACNSCSPAC